MDLLCTEKGKTLASVNQNGHSSLRHSRRMASHVTRQTGTLYTVLRPRTTLRLLLGCILTLSLAGCGLFGSDDDPLDGTLTYEVEGPSEGQISVARTYFYTGESCKVTRSSTERLPFEDTLTPEQDSERNQSTCTDVDLNSFDGVRVSVTFPPTPGASDGLTVRLLSDGDVIDDATAPREGRTWVVEAGNVPRRSDQNPF